MPAAAASFMLSVTLGDDSFSASGKPDQVLKAFEDFKALSGHGGTSTTQPPIRREGRQKQTPPAKPAGDMTLPAFLARLKLKGGAQIGAAIVAWSAQHGKKEKLSPTEVHTLWKQTKYKAPNLLGNVTRDLNEAVKRGYLRKEGERKDTLFYADAYEQAKVEEWVSAPEG